LRNYIIRRLLQMVPVLLLVTLIAFSLMHMMPVDPVAAMLGPEATPEAVATLRHEFGLDRPVWMQYLDWLGNALRGDFGRSLVNRQPVSDLIAQRLPVTLQIGLSAMLLSLLIALPVGILSALRRNTVEDQLSRFIAILGIAVPNFVLGILLILVFSVTLRWLPPSGYTSLFDDPLQSLRLTILPAVTLSAAMAAVTMRQIRSSLLEVMEQDYIRTARSKGLSEYAIVSGHAMKNAMIPVVTILAIQVAILFGGSVIVETIFAIPGIGRLVVNAIIAHDYPIVQAVVLLMGFIVSAFNLLADLSYAILDPRIKYR
jgi:peptide/nickel transport system permease protein